MSAEMEERENRIISHCTYRHIIHYSTNTVCECSSQQAMISALNTHELWLWGHRSLIIFVHTAELLNSHYFTIGWQWYQFSALNPARLTSSKAELYLGWWTLGQQVGVWRREIYFQLEDAGSSLPRCKNTNSLQPCSRLCEAVLRHSGALSYRLILALTMLICWCLSGVCLPCSPS